VAYQWRSSVDGVLSTLTDFSTSSLSVAKHTIFFMVQDNRGDWSKEVYVFVNVVATHSGSPIVNVFQVKPDYIAPGESAVLSWDVSYADTVVISPDIGNVALIGSRTVYPEKNITYVINASNSQGISKAETRVSLLVKQTKTIELYSIAAEDGTVRKDTVVEFEPMVGENASSIPMQAFLSFDISMIPADATILNVLFDMSNHSIYGYPFNYLGAMGVYQTQFTMLESKNYMIGFPGNGLFYAYSDPTKPYESNLFVDAVQSQINKGSTRFQIRIQFERYFYTGGQPHYLGLNSDKIKLTILYQN
jgi:hypothetical protein